MLAIPDPEPEIPPNTEVETTALPPLAATFPVGSEPPDIAMKAARPPEPPPPPVLHATPKDNLRPGPLARPVPGPPPVPPPPPASKTVRLGDVEAFQVAGGRNRTIQIPLLSQKDPIDAERLFIKSQFFEQEQDRPQIVYISEVLPGLKIARSGTTTTLFLSYNVSDSQKQLERDRYGKELRYLGFAMQIWYAGEKVGETVQPDGLAVKPEMLRAVPLPRAPKRR